MAPYAMLLNTDMSWAVYNLGNKMLVKLRAIHGKKPTLTEILKYYLPVPTENTVFNF